MAVWTRQAQEREGTYIFSGTFYVTRGVLDALTQEEIALIYKNIRDFVKEKNGIDYLQVFKDEQGRKLYFIDELNREMLASGNYAQEYNLCTLLWAHEY